MSKAKAFYSNDRYGPSPSKATFTPSAFRSGDTGITRGGTYFHGLKSGERRGWSTMRGTGDATDYHPGQRPLSYPEPRTPGLGDRSKTFTISASEWNRNGEELTSTQNSKAGNGFRRRNTFLYDEKAPIDMGNGNAFSYKLSQTSPDNFGVQNYFTSSASPSKDVGYPTPVPYRQSLAKALSWGSLDSYEERARFSGTDNASAAVIYPNRTYSGSTIFKSEPKSTFSLARLSSDNLRNTQSMPSQQLTKPSYYGSRPWQSTIGDWNRLSKMTSLSYTVPTGFRSRQPSVSSDSSLFAGSLDAINLNRRVSNKTRTLDTFFEMRSKYLEVPTDEPLNVNSCNVAGEATHWDLMPTVYNNSFHRRMSSCFMSEMTRLQKLSNLIKESTVAKQFTSRKCV